MPEFYQMFIAHLLIREMFPEESIFIFGHFVNLLRQPFQNGIEACDVLERILRLSLGYC